MRGNGRENGNYYSTMGSCRDNGQENGNYRDYRREIDIDIYIYLSLSLSLGGPTVFLFEFTVCVF